MRRTSSYVIAVVGLCVCAMGCPDDSGEQGANKGSGGDVDMRVPTMDMGGMEDAGIDDAGMEDMPGDGGDMSGGGEDMTSNDMAPVARTCQAVAADYAVAFEALDRSCTMNSDCQAFTTSGCGITESLPSCNLVTSATADRAALGPLVQEYEQLGCNANLPECQLCEQKAVACEQGACVVLDMPPRTCGDVVTDYAEVYASFSRTCQVDEDCKYAGTSSCGVAQDVVGGCELAIRASEDLAPLTPLAQEYEQLGCNVNTPSCAACRARDVSCRQGICVTRGN